MAYRVPVVDVSAVDLTFRTRDSTSLEQINAAIRAAAGGPMDGVLGYTEDQVVSSDFIGDPHSSIYDAGNTKVIGGNMLKVTMWYDNEWGYSNRTADLAELLMKL